MPRILSDSQLQRAAMGALARARLKLCFGSFDRFRKSLEGGRCSDVGDFDEAERVGRAIEAASRRLPFAGSCLVRATAGMLLLRRLELPGELKIGVAREERRGFEAHAWVECDGKVLIGADERERFTPLRAGSQDTAPTD